LLVDSTGLTLCGAGEWLIEKHGTSTRRSWRTLHLGVDADTGHIVAAAPTNKEVDDAAQVGPLLDQLSGSLSSLIADGAYDQDDVYADVAGRHPEAAVSVCTAVLSDQAATAPTPRDRHLQGSREDSYGLADSLWRQQARQGRGGDRAMETGDRQRLRSWLDDHLNPIERLWELMHKHITHNRCYQRFADFRDAMLTFLRDEVPKNWDAYCEAVSDNFRIINPTDFRILA
jgi:hypothetical protein